MKTIDNEEQLFEDFRKLANAAQTKPNVSASEALASLSDYELLVFIAGKTYEFGRSFKDSVENGLYHMKDRVNAEHQFSTRDKEARSL